MRFVDSHLHLTGEEAEAVVTLGSATGILLVSCGTDRLTSQWSIDLGRLHPEQVKAFVGVHPSEAKSEDLGWLEGALQEAAGLGEVGLDPLYSPVGQKSAQMRVFMKQLEAAQKHAKPVQVHSRGAEAAALDILGTFRLKSVLMHWLESEERLPAALGRGYFVSFGPAVLYSKKLQRMAKKAPPDQVLTETDFPVAYGPLQGAKGPALVPSVVLKLAGLWGVSFDDARAAVAAGTMRYLGLGEKG